MKKITFNLSKEDYHKLQRIIVNLQKETGFRCTVSEVLRSLVVKEEERIPI
tara:strand:+ start:325 stop:477 length:153 start_codon:yes stop_codon:yes gene_type:complete